MDFEDSQFRADGSRLQKFYYYAAQGSGRKDLLQVTHRIYENSDPNDFEEYHTAYFTDGFYARPKGLQYPGGTSVAFGYDLQGHLIEEKDPLSAVVYRQVTAKNSRAQITQASIGFHSGQYQYSYQASYHAATGQANTMTVSNGTANFVDLSYGYEVFGNVASRSTHVGGRPRGGGSGTPKTADSFRIKKGGLAAPSRFFPLC